MAGVGKAIDAAAASQRIDKWLWFARVIKTRTLAAELVTAGKVRINRSRAEKPSQTVRLGDVLTVVANRRLRLFKVRGLGERRGPPTAASALYEELTPVADALKPLAQSTSQGRNHSGAQPGQRPRGSGRPTKRERRQIERLGDKIG